MFLTIATEGQFEFILEKFENSPEDYNFLIIQMSKRNYCRIIYNSISTLYKKEPLKNLFNFLVVLFNNSSSNLTTMLP